MRHGRRPGVRIRAVLVVCLSAGIAFAPSAGATPATDPNASPTTAWSVDGTGGDDPEGPLSGKALQEQVAEAERLTKSLARDNEKIAAAVKELEKYSAEANTLLEAHAKARDEYNEAKREVDEAQRQLENYRDRLADGREDLRA